MAMKFNHPKDENFKMKDLSEEDAHARKRILDKEQVVMRKRKMIRAIFILIGAIVIVYAFLKVLWPALSFLIPGYSN